MKDAAIPHWSAKAFYSGLGFQEIFPLGLLSADFDHDAGAEPLRGVNRDLLRANTAQSETDSYRVDPKMEEVLRYIASHLEEDLSVDALAGRFFMSRYYLMHRFKEVTGSTVHQYTVQKRLLRAGELIREGVPVMKAAEQAGFPEYSSFLRAFQSTFHTSPRSFK